ncbi:MAG: hypothetical protein AB7G37_01985 [Solirubrobacteraceae bacterium]
MTDGDRMEQDDHAARLHARRRAEQAPLEEAGEGESEGFELAEKELIEHASHGDQHSTDPIYHDRGEAPDEQSTAASGDADDVRPEDL